MFENCADETWQLDRFPTRKEKSRTGFADGFDRPRKQLCPFGQAPKEKATSASLGSSLLPRPTKHHGDLKRMPIQSCRRQRIFTRASIVRGAISETRGFEVDLYTFACLEIEIPKFGQSYREATKSATRATVKRERSARKGNEKPK